MAYTYDLSSSDADELLISKVRLLIPDNDSGSYYLQDAEIEYFLDERGDNVRSAAAMACRWLSRKFSQMVSFTADGLTMRHSERARAFADRAAELELEVSGAWSSVGLDREDGFSEAATQADYESRTIYIKV